MFGPLAWLIREIQLRNQVLDQEGRKARLNVVESPTERLKQVLDEATWVVADERNQMYVLPSREELLDSQLFPDGINLEGDASFEKYFLPVSEENETSHAVLMTDPSKFYRQSSLIDRHPRHSADKQRRFCYEGGGRQIRIMEENIFIIDESLSKSEQSLPIRNEQRRKSYPSYAANYRIYRGPLLTVIALFLTKLLIACI